MWFNKYSEDQKMTFALCLKFTNIILSDTDEDGEEKVTNLFKSYDAIERGYLTRDNFIDFYTRSTLDKDKIVRDNLRMHNIRNDLKVEMSNYPIE